MQRTTKISALGAALAIGGMLAFSGQAMADQVKAQFYSVEGGQVQGKVTLPPGSGNAQSDIGGTAGLFYFRDAVNTPVANTSPSGPIALYDDGQYNDQFVSFCIDLADPAPNTVEIATWDIVKLADAPDSNAGPMGSEKATEIAQVLTYALKNSDNNAVNGGDFAINSNRLNDARFLTQDEKQAVQAVIWEIVHEREASYDLALGDISITGLTAGAGTFAGEILVGYSNEDAMRGLVGLTNPTSADPAAKIQGQDFIAQVVPIPAAAWLFGSALFGMAGIGYRRGRKA